MKNLFLNSRRSIAGILALTAVCVTAEVKADVLVNYTFGTAGVNGQGAANGTSANGAWSDVTNSAHLSFASGLNTNGAAGSSMALTYRVSGTLVNNTGGQGTAPAYDVIDARVLTSAATPDPTIFFQFSLTASSDFLLNSLSFDMASGSNTGTRGAGLAYSLDGFSTAGISLGTDTVVDGAAADRFTYFSHDLGGALVSSGQTVTFRFDPFVSTGAAGGVRFDNIKVDGFDAVPEPASMALLGLGGLTALFLKRRRA